MSRLTYLANLVRKNSAMDLIAICKSMSIMPSTAYNYVKILPAFFDDIVWADGQLKVKPIEQ